MRQPSTKLASRSALIEFWFRIQDFLRTRREFAREEGLDATEYEVLLLLKASGDHKRPNVSHVAEKLYLQHHIAAAVVKRLAARGLAVAGRSEVDRRSLVLRLTPAGSSLLQRIVNRSVSGLAREGPEIMAALGKIMNSGALAKAGATPTTQE